MDFKSIITEDIDERFCYIQYAEFRLIMMKENNYINATKLCKLGKKELFHWRRLNGSDKLIKEVEKYNNLAKIEKSPPPDLEGVISGVLIEIGTESKGKHQYEVAGTYVHQDLIPHIASWISPEFAIKVSKIVNCYFSKKYEFKIKEKEDKIDKLQRSLDENNNHMKDLKKDFEKQKKELKKNNKEIKENLKDIKEQNKELKNDNKELKSNINELKIQLNDKVFNPENNNKHGYLVVLQDKNNKNVFRWIRVQKERVDKEIEKFKNRYNVFYKKYEPNPISCANFIKENLSKKKYIKHTYNDFTLIDLEHYNVDNFGNDLERLGFLRVIV